MKRRVAIYVAGVFVAGFCSIPAGIIFEHDIIAYAIGHLLLSVLSYPLGVIATAIGYVLMYVGLATPTETLAVITPIAALLGYLQWFRIMPALYKKQAF